MTRDAIDAQRMRMVALAALLAAAPCADAASPLEEAQASRFLYCANVFQFVYQDLARNDPGNPGLPGFDRGRLLFRLAAARRVDDGVLDREHRSTQKAFLRLLDEQSADPMARSGPRRWGAPRHSSWRRSRS